MCSQLYGNKKCPTKDKVDDAAIGCKANYDFIMVNDNGILLCIFSVCVCVCICLFSLQMFYNVCETAKQLNWLLKFNYKNFKEIKIKKCFGME